MGDNKSVDVGQVWWFWFTTNAFAVDKRLRHIFRILPHDPRCKFCNAPFQGVGGALVRAMFGKQRSELNPGFCNLCEQASREFPGGAEVEMSMLFADVRGSTALSEKMSATEFSQLINRFYTRRPMSSSRRMAWWRSWPGMRSLPFGEQGLQDRTTWDAP
jgi:hypothetical protein